MKNYICQRYILFCSFELLSNVFEFLLKDLEQSQFGLLGHALIWKGAFTAFEFLVDISPMSFKHDILLSSCFFLFLYLNWFLVLVKIVFMWWFAFLLMLTS